ncbi:unnamed protein product [Trifolium pratense]|uniref:Uncharacterized protein n=1 Tax=Trifolium pratense TaxID=57577 RepID=A0ACB0JLI2_TRIPR|nr:unnamed protein product [Trifolium pratense]
MGVGVGVVLPPEQIWVWVWVWVLISGVGLFNWTPYDVSQCLYPEDVACWSATTFLINFEVVEFHQTDRVRLQCGFQHARFQGVPQVMTSYHNTTMRSSVHDWAAKFMVEIQHWNNRHNCVLVGDQVDGVPMHSTEFLNDYTRFNMPYLSSEHYLFDPRPRPDVQQNTFTQHTDIPDPPSFSPQQQHTSQPFTDQYPNSQSNFFTPLPYTRNFFDDQSFQSPGTQRFNENAYHPGEPQQTQQTQQTQHIPLHWGSAVPDDMLNSTWAAGEGSSLSQSFNQLENFLNRDDTNAEEELYGRGHPRNAGPPPCGTGGHRRHRRH